MLEEKRSPTLAVVVPHLLISFYATFPASDASAQHSGQRRLCEAEWTSDFEHCLEGDVSYDI